MNTMSILEEWTTIELYISYWKKTQPKKWKDGWQSTSQENQLTGNNHQIYKKKKERKGRTKFSKNLLNYG